MIERDDLEKLVRRNPGQGTVDEYARIVEVVRKRVPGKVLVFGVGRDSEIWIRANEGGETVFLENEAEWIRMAREKNPGARIHQVEYDTRRFLWRWYLHREERLFMNDLPGEVLHTDWDVIFVDSPQGQSWKRPGRMKSIYTAGRLARTSAGEVDVLIHDCDRTVERVYSDTYLGDRYLVARVDRLRHYRLPAAPG
ncbi:MAG: hypothetical protein ACOC8K_09350 [Gemmatimonadota bacterium]